MGGANRKCVDLCAVSRARCMFITGVVLKELECEWTVWK